MFSQREEDDLYSVIDDIKIDSHIFMLSVMPFIINRFLVHKKQWMLPIPELGQWGIIEIIWVPTEAQPNSLEVKTTERHLKRNAGKLQIIKLANILTAANAQTTCLAI